ncbi:MAG: class I SAM-dependent methyltransferase [Deltaproteobacteria bacterium]|nr:class I SAM-dependent methyltransferase [Deltaproteobacteria bacterium]
MPIPSQYELTRYLASKKTVDDRALNQTVMGELAERLAAIPPPEPIRVLEVGAGIGAMVERLLEWEILDNAIYTALDYDAGLIAEAERRLPEWAPASGFQAVREGRSQIRLRRGKQDVLAQFEIADVLHFIKRKEQRGRWDLLIANAFLDLMDIPSALPALFALLRPGGLFYFTINFDGATILLPEIDPRLDDKIEQLYHETMDRRIINGKQSGHSRTGRRLFRQIPEAVGEILAAGASDWVVHPRDGAYPADEAYFLHFIVHTIGQALEGHPALAGERFADWIDRRHAQIEAGELVYIAHQIDFLGQAH